MNSQERLNSQERADSLEKSNICERSNNRIKPEEQLTRLLRFCGKQLHHGLGGRCSQDRILMTINRSGRITQRELADGLGIQSGSMSEIIGKLEEKELICRIKNESDRRNLDIELTESGKEEARRVKIHREAVEKRLYSPLSAEEKEQLIGLLDKLASAWKQEEGR